jgi:hypothetical protein
MMRALARAKRSSLVLAASRSEAIEADRPMHIVDTGGRMKCIVS